MAVLVAGSPEARGQALVYAWGETTYHQLGTTPSSGNGTPQPVIGLPAGPKVLGATVTTSYTAVNGKLYAWGDGGSWGPNPQAVTGLATGVTGIGYGHVIQNGAAYKVNASNASPVVAAVPVLTSGVTDISGFAGYNNAIKAGAVYAWADNATPQLVAGLSSGVTAISVSKFGSPNLAIQGDAAVYYGGSSGTQAVPVLTSGVTSVAVGQGQFLAVKSGQLYSWGSSNSNGKLGNGTTSSGDGVTPQLLTAAGLPSNFSKVGAGFESSYALTTTGRLYAWGYGDSGRLGVGGGSNLLVPTEVFAPAGYMWSDFSAGGRYVLATAVPVPEPAFVLTLSAVGGAAVGAGRRWRRGGRAG